MVRLNKVQKAKDSTFEGASAIVFTPERQLERAVMNCFLWESQFYEDGEAIADRITKLVALVQPAFAADLAIRAREDMKLRHAPLLVVRAMARLETHRSLVGATLARIIQRPDEMTEFLAIYWQGNLGPLEQRRKEKLAKQVKLGLATAFGKFDAYQLAKYDREGPVRLRDVLFLTHPKPANDVQRDLWKGLVDGKLPVPDTWETALSGGADKKETWLRLLAGRKLGALALLRNLRNMSAAGVPEDAIRDALAAAKIDRVLPYRFIAAARHAPALEDVLEAAMLRAVAETPKLRGKWRLLVDVSGSMDEKLSAKSDLKRLDAACGLAILAREICEEVEIHTFSYNTVRVPPRRGFALRDAIVGSQPHGGTDLGKAVREIDRPDAKLIVFTDEQSRTPVQAPASTGYMVNVASAKNGIGYGPWQRIDGFSERMLDWIADRESERTE
jgi:hypothetical protein